MVGGTRWVPGIEKPPTAVLGNVAHHHPPAAGPCRGLQTIQWVGWPGKPMPPTPYNAHAQPYNGGHNTAA